MYSSPFEYVRAETVEEAVSLLKRNDDAMLLAGGQSLVPLQKTGFAAPEQVIDINHIAGLDAIEDTEGGVRIGALAHHTDIQKSPLVREHAFLFAECIGQIADAPVRNQGTLGGTIAEADPSGDYLPVMEVLDPDITIVGPDGERTVPFSEFYLGMFTVDLGDAEMITAAELPKLEPTARTAIGSTYKKHAERSGDYALVGVAAVVEVDVEAVVMDTRLTIGAVGPLTRSQEAEETVEGTTLGDDALAAAREAAMDAVVPDEEGIEGEYKRAMAGEFTGRALRTAYDRATEAL